MKNRSNFEIYLLIWKKYFQEAEITEILEDIISYRTSILTFEESYRINCAINEFFDIFKRYNTEELYEKVL